MELNDLKNIWDKQKSGDRKDNPELTIVGRIDEEIDSLEKDIRKRDNREIVICIFLIICFSVIFFLVQSMWMRIGCAIIVLSCTYICYKLKTSQIESSTWNQSYDRALDEHLRNELQQVLEQKNLLKNIAWWYISPLILGLVFLTLGSNATAGFKSIYLSFILILGVVAWIWNQQVVQKKLNPIIQDLEEALEMIDDDHENTN